MEGPTVEETTEEQEVEGPTEAETSEPAEAETSEVEEGPQEEMIPKSEFEKFKYGTQKRINREVAKTKAEAAARAEAEARLQQAGISPEDKPLPPTPEEFSDEYGEVDSQAFKEAMAAYQDTFYDWKESSRRKQTAEERRQEEVNYKWEQFNTASEPLRAKYSDFDEVINKEVFGPELGEVLLEDQLSEVAYYLGKNESEAVRLSQVAATDPLQLMRELGKLETKVTSMSKGTSNAPPPISPIEGKGEPAIDESKMSDQEIVDRWRRQRLEKIKKQFG